MPLCCHSEAYALHCASISRGLTLTVHMRLVIHLVRQHVLIMHPVPSVLDSGGSLGKSALPFASHVRNHADM